MKRVSVLLCTGGLICRAEKENAPDLPPKPTDDEARLEAFESSLRVKKGSKSLDGAAARGPSPSTQESSAWSEWRAGELFPQGWENMDPVQKAAEIWMGKRGFLFWSQKLAGAGVVVLLVSWVIFRFVAPALFGLKLADSGPNF